MDGFPWFYPLEWWQIFLLIMITRVQAAEFIPRAMPTFRKAFVYCNNALRWHLLLLLSGFMMIWTSRILGTQYSFIHISQHSGLSLCSWPTELVYGATSPRIWDITISMLVVLAVSFWVELFLQRCRIMENWKERVASFSETAVVQRRASIFLFGEDLGFWVGDK